MRGIKNEVLTWNIFCRLFSNIFKLEAFSVDTKRTCKLKMVTRPFDMGTYIKSFLGRENKTYFSLGTLNWGKYQKITKKTLPQQKI